jgi:hypothetical protein
MTTYLDQHTEKRLVEQGIRTPNITADGAVFYGYRIWLEEADDEVGDDANA